jgi:hypothetical protein
MRNSQQYFLRIDLIHLEDSQFSMLRVWQSKQIVKYLLSKDQERDLLSQLLKEQVIVS